MPKKTWIEVALNGASTRKAQPRIPVLASEIIEEGVACVKAGAAIVHAHTLEPDSGRQNGNVDNCAAFINGIRERVDAIVYPTVIGRPDPSNPAWLWEPTVELARRGILEWGFIDPGSVNLCFVNPDGPAMMGGNGVYVNSNPALDRAARLAVEYRFHPAYACYEAGFVRHGALLHRRNPDMPAPIYRFMFSSGMTFSFPPETWAIQAYLKLLEMSDPGSPWLVAGLAVDIMPLIPFVVAHGGGLRVGLEDASFGTRRSNLELVEAAVSAVQKAGSEPASAAEIRADLAAFETAAKASQ